MFLVERLPKESAEAADEPMGKPDIIAHDVHYKQSSRSSLTEHDFISTVFILEVV